MLRIYFFFIFPFSKDFYPGFFPFGLIVLVLYINFIFTPNDFRLFKREKKIFFPLLNSVFVSVVVAGGGGGVGGMIVITNERLLRKSYLTSCF